MEEKKQGKGLVVALVLFILTTLVSCGYLVYDKVLTKGKESTTVKETVQKEVEPKEDEEGYVLTKFDGSYELTDDDKTAIAEEIEKQKAANNYKVDKNSINISNQEEGKCYLSVEFKFDCNESSCQDKLSAIVLKSNNKIRVYNWGSGFTTEDFDKINKICS